MTSEGSPAAHGPGEWSVEGLRLAILVARFNSDVTERLLAGAHRCVADAHGRPASIDVYHVPGAFELPQAAARVVALGRHDAVVALGCVIRGETPHFEYVSSEAARGLGAVARASAVPLAFGVLTTDDRAQALARAGEGSDNKGYEAVLAALEMAALLRRMERA